MKRSGLTPLFLSATLFLPPFAPFLMHAQDTAMAAPAAKGSKRGEELLRRFDKNGDGRLDDDERAEAKEIMMKEQLDRQMARVNSFSGGIEQFRTQMLEMFDKNRDGRLDEEERQVAQAFAERGTGERTMDDLTRRFDRNGNGQIDPDEREIIEKFAAQLRSYGANQMREELLRRFDRNADGKIDGDEMNELESAARPRIEANALQRRRYDKNGDGRIDDAEWTMARAAVAAWLNGAGEFPFGSEPPHPDAKAASVPNGAATSPEQKRLSPEEEQRRLQAVADEVARRRASRAAQKTEPK